MVPGVGGTCQSCERHFKEGDRCPFDASPLDPPTEEAADPLVGTTIDAKFLIEARIGSGGMGVVYAARQLSLDRIVALKVLAPGVNADRRAEQRFRVEARAASQLRNPHAVTVHDFGVTPDGLLYIAMELLEGDSLRARMRSGPLDIRAAVQIAAQVAEALAEAHARTPPIIHRDVKPDNVVVRNSAEGEPFATVLDFGLALVLTDQRLTAANIIVGTVAYMAPEQAISGREIDDRVDIYALGISLYEMIRGETPFKSPHQVALLHQHVYDTPPSLRDQVPQVPSSLDRLVLEMLAKDPTSRPSARFVRQRLADILQELPRTAPAQAAPTPSTGAAVKPPSPVTRRTGRLTPSEARAIADVISGGLRVRQAISLVAIVAVVLVVLVSILVWRLTPSGTPHDSPRATDSLVATVQSPSVTQPLQPPVAPPAVLPSPVAGAISSTTATAPAPVASVKKARRSAAPSRPASKLDPRAVDADILQQIEGAPADSKHAATKPSDN